MTRLPLLSESEMSPDQREQFARFPSNLTRALLVMDRRMARALPELANAIRASSLEDRLREAAILRVAFLCESSYERMQHYEQAIKCGWSNAAIEALEAGKVEGLSPELKGVIAFVDECVNDAQVSDLTLERLKKFLAASEIATLIFLIGHYMAVARFVAIVGIPLDDKPDGWLQEH